MSEYVPLYMRNQSRRYVDVSGPDTTNTDTSKEVVNINPRRRRQGNLEPGERPKLENQIIQAKIAAHKAALARLKADLTVQQEPCREEYFTYRIICLRRVELILVRRLEPSDLTLLPKDPDDSVPPFTDDIMNTQITRRFKMSSIKIYD